MNRFRKFADKLLKNTIGAETAETVVVGACLLGAAAAILPGAKSAIESTGGQIPGFISTASGTN